MTGKELTYGLPVQLANEAKYNLFLYDNEKLCISSYRPYYESAELIVKGEEYEGVQETGRKPEMVVWPVFYAHARIGNLVAGATCGRCSE